MEPEWKPIYQYVNVQVIDIGHRNLRNVNNGTVQSIQILKNVDVLVGNIYAPMVNVKNVHVVHELDGMDHTLV